MALGRMYSMSFKDITVAAAQDFFELVAATSGVTILHGVYLAQDTLVGDANEDFHHVVIYTGATADGSGGSVGVEVPLSLGDSAATAVGRTNDTTESGTGTIVAKHMDSYNTRVGWQYLPPPEQRISWSANILSVTLLNTPTSLDMQGTLIWEELD